MSDLEKVAAGEKVKLAAADWNEFIDTARERRQGKLGQHADTGLIQASQTTVQVCNGTGFFQPAGAILGINDSLYSPSTQYDNFRNEIAVLGVIPSSENIGRFVVLLESLPAGAVGEAVAKGLTQARVYFPTGDRSYADIDTGSSARLYANPSGGNARIILSESGIGERWAIVDLGYPQPLAWKCSYDPDGTSRTVPTNGYFMITPISDVSHPTYGPTGAASGISLVDQSPYGLCWQFSRSGVYQFCFNAHVKGGSANAAIKIAARSIVSGGGSQYLHLSTIFNSPVITGSSFLTGGTIAINFVEFFGAGYILALQNLSSFSVVVTTGQAHILQVPGMNYGA